MYTKKDIDNLKEDISLFNHLLKNETYLGDPHKKLDFFYAALKEMAPSFYDEGIDSMTTSYNETIRALERCEFFAVPFDYIIPFCYEEDLKSTKGKIVHSTFEALIKKSKNPLTSISELDFRNKCYQATNTVYEMCTNQNIPCVSICIFPGFSEEAQLLKKSGYHWFNLILEDNECFLIDCSYWQFFTKTYCNANRINIASMTGRNPGYYMMQNGIRGNVALEILKHGYIKITKSSFKSYLDGFALSYRNGLYYTQNPILETEYTPDDYLRFLNNEDNQINHEGTLVLGRQKAPIKKDLK